MPRFTKSQGLTPSEQYLARLCEKSFLSLWSYPNLYYNKNKFCPELCDLLVVFGEHVIIFSDKSCQFKPTNFDDVDELLINWKRWYKKSIIESVNDLYGAERWIRTNPHRIFIDNKCQQLLPIQLPSSDKMKVHRVAIALNIKQPCIDFFGNGSGSLPIRNCSFDDALNTPFTIGVFNQPDKIVHVFDDVTLDLVLKELDTVPDFVAYLNKKELLITQGKFGTATGEEDLLAHYLKNMNEQEEHDFCVPDHINYAAFFEGIWTGYVGNPQYKAKKQADEISYLWDALIESFNKNVIGGTLEYGNDESIHNHEIGLRALASENRFERRGLSRSFRDALQKSEGRDRFSRVSISPHSSKAYLFLFLQNKYGKTHDEYRRVRSNMLQIYCQIIKNQNRHLKEIVGIATEPYSNAQGRSEDLVHYSCDFEVTPEFEKETVEIQEKIDALKESRFRYINYHDQEYPEVALPKRERGGLNRKARRKIKALTKTE